jgi:DNA-binding LytR/AlgR family response regulator
VATASVDAAYADGKLVFDFLRFGLCDGVFADIAFPKMAGQAGFAA